MVDHTDRRRFLQVAGTGSLLSLAGCSAFQIDGRDGGGDGDDGTDATVTVAVEPDREALQQRRSEIRSQVRSGNMSRTEARQAMQAARAELMADATEAFERRVADESALAIDESVAELGAFRVTGSPAALIGTLSAAEVSALLPEPVFERARTRANDGGDTRTRAPGTPE